MVVGEGVQGRGLGLAEVKEIMDQGTPPELYRGKRVLVLTPDATRTCPLPMMVRAVKEVVGRECARLDFMVALGTHPPMGRDSILALYNIRDAPGLWEGCDFMDHRWDRPDTFTRLGSIGPNEVEAISGGLLREEVPIEVNRAALEHDLILILGPVFPHEVVGFSGGAKYLFPGISGGEFLHFFHWLGAVITCKRIIGVKDTPVRRMIHRAMREIPVPMHCLAMVVGLDGSLCGFFAGDLEGAWSRAVDLSSMVHVVNKDRPYRVVLGQSPAMYEEIWTAGKVMYKLEQVVAPGGTLIIYAPHVREVSRSWGHHIERIGYHTRDYFLTRMERFGDVPRGVLAHLTHVKGTGTFLDDVEVSDVNVVLATGISQDVCERINLGYMDPARVRLDEYKDREQEGVLFVDHAGEILYRLLEEQQGGRA